MWRPLFYQSQRVFTQHLNLAALLLYLVVALAMIWPQLQQRYPALIDDGTDILAAKQLSFQQLFITDLVSQERTWPLRMQYRKILYTLFGEHIEWHFGINLLLLVGVMVLLRQLLVKVGVRPSVAIITPVVVAIFPSVYEATYRLGPIELIQTSFYLVGLWLLLHKQYLFATIVFCLNLLNKETSIFYLLPLAVHLLAVRKKWLLFGMGVMLVSLLMLIWYKSDHISATYVINSQFSWDYIARGLNWRTWTFGLLLLNFILVMSKTKFDLHRVIVLTAYLSTFIPFFVWDIGKQYYYQLPNHILGLLCLMMLFDDFWQNTKSRTEKWLKVGLMVVILWWQVVAVLWPHSLWIKNHWQKVYYIGGKLVQYVLENDLSNTNVYIAVADYEEHNKIELYVRDWRDREINLTPTSQEWYENQSDREMLETLAAAATESFLADPTSNKLLISDRFIASQAANELEVLPFCTKPKVKYKDCWFYLFSPKQVGEN